MRFVNQNNGRRFRAAWMEVKLAYGHDVAALTRIKLDIGVRWKVLQLGD